MDVGKGYFCSSPEFEPLPEKRQQQPESSQREQVCHPELQQGRTDAEQVVEQRPQEHGCAHRTRKVRPCKHCCPPAGRRRDGGFAK